jgi:hypothetical protein
MQRPSEATRESPLRHGLPWLALGAWVLVLALRAWSVQAGVPDESLSSLTEYLPNVLGLWLRGSGVLLAVGALLSPLPSPRPVSRPERLGWAWASWSAFLACVPPREGNFWAAGAADDEFFVYLPTTLLAVASAWASLVALRSSGLVHLWLGLSLVSAAGWAVFGLLGGHGIDEPARAAAVTAGLSGGLAVAALLYRRRASPPRAAA